LPPTGGTGPLGNMSPDRLRARLDRLGWKLRLTERIDVPGCTLTRLSAEKPRTDAGAPWADVFLFECTTRNDAAWQAARLRKNFADSWTIDDGLLVLDVATNDEAGSSEQRSKALADQLIKP
jgi:hypothetical protein